MKYEVIQRHCFFENNPVRMFFINEMPFAMDPLGEEEKQDKWILSECAINPEYTLDAVSYTHLTLPTSDLV